MRLVDLLVQELPNRGGWPKGVDAVEQGCEGELFEKGSDYCSDFKLEKCDDWLASVVTKQQYEAALAASKAVVGHNGWVQWSGGDCPVDSDAIVEVKYRSPNPYQYNNDRAGDFDWAHTGTDADIIAYRLRRDINARANDDQLEQDLNECIGQDVVTEWDGDGLPPAGCECEARYRNANAEWAFFRCVVVDCGVAFGWSGKEAVTLGVDSYEFRPLRTEAEMAREKLAASLHIAAGASPIELNGIGPLYFKLADAIISGNVFGTTFKAGK